MRMMKAGAFPHLSPGRWLWGVCADVIVFLSTLAVAIISIVLTTLTRTARANDVLAPLWSRFVLAICGVRVEVEGLENIDPRRSYVAISNHLSNFDIWAALAALPLRLRFVAKKELTRLPFFGQALAMSEHVVIDRNNPEEAVARINARVAAQGSAPFCILFFAEGTRSPDGQIHAFKKGGVNLALRTALPILPLTIKGTWTLLPKGAWIIRPGGRVKLVVGQPIETAGRSIEERDHLNEQVRQAIVGNFEKGKRET